MGSAPSTSTNQNTDDEEQEAPQKRRKISNETHRWPIVDFKKQCQSAQSKKKVLIGDAFNLTNHPSAHFAFFIKPTGHLFEDKFGIILAKLDEPPITITLKFWLENEQGEKFYENLVKNQTFTKVNDRCEFGLNSSINDWNLFCGVYDDQKTLFICCEELDSNICVQSTNSQNYELRSSFWATYERGEHDAIIRVGQKQFKIYKNFFTTQSDIFHQLFKNAMNERKKNEIVIDDIDEKTMKMLIKWIYLGQLDNSSTVEKLFEIADKYQIQSLKKTCTKIMLNDLNNDNVLKRLVLSVLHKEDNLKIGTLNFIGKMSRNALFDFGRYFEWFTQKNDNPKVAKDIYDLIQEKLY